MPTRIQVENVVKIFGDSPREALAYIERGASKEEILKDTGNVVGLSGVSFKVEQGEIFVVMGLSGCGKSTLIRCLNRLITPTSGRALIDDEDILLASEERLRELRRTKLSMVFQHFALFPHKTVVQNVEYGLKVRKISARERRERALEALASAGLREWADRHPQNLSGGMQQRVGLARALATDPDILLMDEAFSALDPLIRRDMQDELIQLQRSVRKTIVFITHDLNEALKLGDHIAVMKDGGIVQIGAPEEIVSQPADDYVADFIQDIDRGRVFAVSSAMRQADTLVRGEDSVLTARSRMGESGRAALYVVDPHPGHQCLGGPVGLVTGKDLAGAAHEGTGELERVIQTDFPRTRPSCNLVDIYGLCVAGLPIAALDDEGCLQGVVDPLDVLAHLAADGQLDAPGKPGPRPPGLHPSDSRGAGGDPPGANAPGANAQ